jgi:hypothetical protein
MAAFDLSTLEPIVQARLGATSWDDLTWLEESELYSYFDECAKRLAHQSGVFIERDTGTNLTANEAQYAAPENWIATLHLSVSNRRLRPTSVAGLLALDSTWQTTPCAMGQMPTRYSDDAGPLGTVTLYPIPQQQQAGETLGHVYQQFPADISTTQMSAPVPAPVADYFGYFAAMRARGKESEGAMSEMSAHFDQRCQMYETLFAHYWGEEETA